MLIGIEKDQNSQVFKYFWHFTIFYKFTNSDSGLQNILGTPITRNRSDGLGGLDPTNEVSPECLRFDITAPTRWTGSSLHFDKTA